LTFLENICKGSAGRSFQYYALGLSMISTAVIGKMSTPRIRREDTLRDILQHLADEPTESYKKPRILSFWGLAGEGKSHLAREIALRSRERYSGVYWIDASTDVTAMQSFDALATELGFQGSHDPQQYSQSVK
jgi:hypothetical protein